MIRSVHFLYGLRETPSDLRSVIDRIALAGAEGVEIPVDPFLGGNASLARDLRLYAESKGVELIFSTGFPPGCDMASDLEEERQSGAKHMENVLQLMEDSGIRFVGGTLCTVWPSFRHKTLSMSEKKFITERTAEVFRNAISRAEERGLELAIEPVNRFEGFLINTAKEAAEFCQLVDNPSLGIMLDGFHIAVEENSVRGAILDAGQFLRHLHCAENNRNLPGTGEFPWDSFFAALREIDYKGRFGIESFVVAGGGVSASIALWRDLVGNTDIQHLDKALSDSLAFIEDMAIKYGF